LQFWPRGYVGVDKIGRPIYVERVGLIKVTELLKVSDEDLIWKYYNQDFENLIKWRMMACSDLYDR